VLRKVGVTALGGLLLVAGAAALLLPGPGLLLLLAGLVVLSSEYRWAARWVAPVRRKAMEATAAGVATYGRLLLSTACALLLAATGVVWWIDPPIPAFGPIGPRLPLGGWEVGLSLIASGLVGLGLLVYSVLRFRRNG
jgi:Putative transmembrane protein (PGPGW)